METVAVFEKKIAIEPRDLNKINKNGLDDLILQKLRTEIEGKCSNHGWVLPNSLKLISRSLCQIENGRFTGSMITWVQAEGTVIYPTDGMNVVASVIKKNKMGMFAKYKDAIQIMIPRDLHLGNEDYESVAIGDDINIEIKKSTYQLNDPYILSVGIFLNKTNGEEVTETTGEGELESQDVDINALIEEEIDDSNNDELGSEKEDKEGYKEGETDDEDFEEDFEEEKST